jgi:hypothetical protein
MTFTDQKAAVLTAAFWSVNVVNYETFQKHQGKEFDLKLGLILPPQMLRYYSEITASVTISHGCIS